MYNNSPYLKQKPDRTFIGQGDKADSQLFAFFFEKTPPPVGKRRIHDHARRGEQRDKFLQPPAITATKIEVTNRQRAERCFSAPAIIGNDTYAAIVESKQALANEEVSFAMVGNHMFRLVQPAALPEASCRAPQAFGIGQAVRIAQPRASVTLHAVNNRAIGQVVKDNAPLRAMAPIRYRAESG